MKPNSLKTRCYSSLLAALPGAEHFFRLCFIAILAKYTGMLLGAVLQVSTYLHIPCPLNTFMKSLFLQVNEYEFITFRKYHQVQTSKQIKGLRRRKETERKKSHEKHVHLSGNL